MAQLVSVIDLLLGCGFCMGFLSEIIKILLPWVQSQMMRLLSTAPIHSLNMTFLILVSMFILIEGNTAVVILLINLFTPASVVSLSRYLGYSITGSLVMF